MSEPTILVKRADGTAVRVPLSQLPGRQASALPPAAPKPATPPKPAAQPPVAPEAATPTPTVAPVAPPRMKHENTESTKTHPHSRAHASAIHHPHAAQVSQRDKKKEHGRIAPPPVRPDLRLELRSRVLRPRESQKLDTRSTDDHKSLLEDDSPVAPERAIAMTTPVVKIFVDEAIANMRTTKNTKVRNTNEITNSRQPGNALTNKPINQSTNYPRSDIRPPISGSVKPMMSDVTAPAAGSRKAMGPVDEIRAMTLTDWRRLGPTAVQAGPQLAAKFMSLKDESPLMYLAARESWPKSPLFRAYAGLVASALGRKQTLAEAAALGGKGGITMEEIKAIIEVNKQLT